MPFIVVASDCLLVTKDDSIDPWLSGSGSSQLHRWIVTGTENCSFEPLA